MLLGIDLGTTGVKAIVFDEDGQPAGEGFRPYGIIYSTESWAEQDAELLFSYTKEAVREAACRYGSQIKAISVSVQGDAVIPIDRDRRAIDYAQLGMDYRGSAEAKECSEMFGGQNLFAHTGMRPHPMNSIVKIFWMKKNRPDIYDKAYKFVTYADYILGKFGSDEITIDASMAGRTMAYDIHSHKWDRAILNELDISEEKLGIPVQSGTVVGTIQNALAEELGISSLAVLAAGGHDQTCAALGAGVVKSGTALDSHGTAEVISAALPKPRLTKMMYDSYYPCYPHVVKDTYFTFGLNHTSGLLLKWFAETFCEFDMEKAKEQNVSVYVRLMGMLQKEPSRVMMMPYLNGTGTPDCDLHMKGGFLGLTMDTGKADMIKAVLEAQGFELKRNLERMRCCEIPIDELRCVGGGAKTAAGVQLKADILGLPVTTLRTREAACLGAALLAGTAVGIYRNTEEAVSLIGLDTTYYPRVPMNKLYEERFLMYEDLYKSLKDRRLKKL